MMKRCSPVLCRGLVSLLAALALAAAGHAEDGGAWLSGTSRARPTLDAYGNPAFEMTNTRYDRLELRLPERKGVLNAVFEEVTDRRDPGGPTVDAHTRLRVWSYDQRKPKLADPLYTIDIDCDGGRFLSDPSAPDFYELTCGAGADYRFKRLYRASDGVFVGEADYDPVSLGISSENHWQHVWASLRVLDYPMPHYDHPPYPFALLTFMTRDAVLDRVVVAADDRDHAEMMAAIADSSHRLVFADVGGLAVLLGDVPESELSSVRLVYFIQSDRAERVLIPLTVSRFDIDKAVLPKGFSLIRVPPSGNLNHGLVTPKLRDLN